MTKEKERKGIFETLYGINVGGDLEEKNKFKYLKWAVAFRILLEHYPKSTWRVLRRDEVDVGIDASTVKGYTVGTEITVVGDDETITRTEFLPVINYSNKVIPEPSTMDINTSIKRCYVKTFAHLGLGLGVYEGQTYPEDCSDPEVKSNGNGHKKNGIEKLEAVLNKAENEVEATAQQALADETGEYAQELQRVVSGFHESKQKAKIGQWVGLNLCLPTIKNVSQIPDVQAREILITEGGR